ncbi:MAG: hypothetical protein QOE55_8089, partial [Acidobacteriaceae bacterium]|nr:hypothetical protein [Acidobacteriaceae bacterium]
VSPPLQCSAAEWKGRSAAEVCTSAARKIGDAACRARGAKLPLARLVFDFARDSVPDYGRALREGTARRGRGRKTARIWPAAAGRRNPPFESLEKKDAILSTGSLVLGLNAI